MKRKKVLVVGLGRFGSSLVDALWKAGAETIAVDTHTDAVDAVKDRAGAAFVGDATDAKVLEGVGAADADAAVVTFGEAFESTVLCVVELRRLGVREVVARAATPRHAEVLRAVGATRVVQIEQDMGRRVATDLLTPVGADLLQFADDHRVVPWVAHGALVGKTLAEAELRRRYGITVIGWRRQDAEAPPGRKPRFEVPGPDYAIGGGDTLLLVGSNESIQRFVEET